MWSTCFDRRVRDTSLGVFFLRECMHVFAMCSVLQYAAVCFSGMQCGAPVLTGVSGKPPLMCVFAWVHICVCVRVRARDSRGLLSKICVTQLQSWLLRNFNMEWVKFLGRTHRLLWFAIICNTLQHRGRTHKLLWAAIHCNTVLQTIEISWCIWSMRWLRLVGSLTT